MGLFHNIFGLPKPTQPNKLSVTGQAPHSSGTNLPSLVKGTIVKGEVIDLRSNAVTVRLDDGTMLQAKLATAMTLAIGQRAEFFVQETNDVLITLKLLSEGENSSAEEIIDKALDAAGLPRSAHNADIVRSLLTAGLPAGKEMIQKMMQYSAANSGVELSTLTALLKHNLPVTKENATGLQTYRNFEHRLAGQASVLASSLTLALTDDSLPASVSGDLFLKFFPSGEDSFTEPAVTPGLPHEDIAVADSVDAGTDTAALTPDSSVPSSSLAEPSLIRQVPVSEEGYSVLSAAIKQLPEDSPERAYLQTQIDDKTLTADRLFTALSSLAQKEQVKPLLSVIRETPEFTELLQTMITDRFLMSPEDLTEDNFIEQFYEKLTKDLKTLQHLTEAAGDSPLLKTASDTAKNMQDNLQFMHTINQVFPYVQLPMLLSGTPTHGELYVYTKKKDLSATDKEVSILLHLDMDTLGPTDIHLSMLQKSVSANFYLSDDASVTLVSEHLPELTEQLQKKGYTFRATTEKRTREPDIVSDFMDGGETVSMKRFRFDIRA